MAELAQADADVLAGCYDCLREARDTYGRLAAGPVASVAVERRFEAEVLIVLREKELAIDTGPSMMRATAAAEGLAPEVGAARILKVVAEVPANGDGWPAAVLRAFSRAHLPDAATVDADLAWLAASPVWLPVRNYVTLSVLCAQVGRPYRPGDDTATADDPPLLAYRRATCGMVRNRDLLQQLHDASPRFAETAYYLARASVGTQQSEGSRKARALVAEAYARFPESPAVTYLAGGINQLAGNCREGLRDYDETLALQPLHENAQLGRTMCLTYLNRPEEAIEAATRLLGWRSTNQRDAFYWRAYNHRLQHRLPMARQDIEASKRLGSSVENRTLAGIIEYEQDDLTPSAQDLAVAWTMSGTHGCTAAWYLGLVHIKENAWAEAGAAFEQSMGCYQGHVDDDRAGLAAMQGRLDLDPDFRDSQIRNFLAAIDEDEKQRHASAMNAANTLVNAGDFTNARRLLAIAEADPSLAEAVTSLKAFMADHDPGDASRTP
jgi:tetratricopeptide (TPR) repeat protein